MKTLGSILSMQKNKLKRVYLKLGTACNLHCKYCHAEHKDIKFNPDILPVLKDFNLTRITFGGGEPLLNSQYIKDVLELGAKEWNVTVETSLNVPVHHVKLLMPYIDEYIVDIKDMNPEIYQKYTGRNNRWVKDNLQWLVKRGMADRIICRIPLIEGYNKPEDQEKSKAELLEMGITRFDLFTYTVREEKTNIVMRKRSNITDKLFFPQTLGLMKLTPEQNKYLL